MTRTRKWFVGLGLGIGVLMLVTIGSVSFIPTDDDLAAEAGMELESALGVKVSLGELHWRPRQAQLRLPGAKSAADLSLARQGLNDRWRVSINLGGGTANGEVQLQTRPNGRLQLDGKLKPHQIEVADALTAFNRRPVMAGKASGDSTLSASGVDAMALAQSLHTQTLFAISNATLLRFDLGKAVRSVGKDHAGQTPLDTVAGQMDTQNGLQGMVVDFSDIKARSGALSASGNATLANRHIEAEFAGDLVDGVVGVPLKVSGPTDHVVVTVPGGAIAGAVVGKLFGSSKAPRPATAMQ